MFKISPKSSPLFNKSCSLACLSLHNWLYNQAFFLSFIHSLWWHNKLFSLFSAFFSLVELITKDISIEEFPSLSSSTCQQLTTNYNFMCAYTNVYIFQLYCQVHFFGLVTFLVTSHLLTFSHDKLNFLSGLFCCYSFFSSRATCSQLLYDKSVQ